MRQTFLIALIALLLGCQSPPPNHAPDGRGAARIGQEPGPAAAFVAAFATGDEARADGLASALYRDEWARRAVSIEDRLAVVPHRRMRTASSPEWIRFHLEAGVRDANGFGHLIYTARPPAWVGVAGTSVWRFDVDPEDRVIWCELVWLFSEDAGAVELVRSAPPGLEGGRALLGVRSTAGPEGYYALAGAPGTGDRPNSVRFLAVGPEGGTRVGAWSYGDPPQTGARRRPRLTPPAAPAVVALRASYVETL